MLKSVHVMLVLLALTMLCTAGCGSGGGSSSAPPATTPNLVTGVGWYYENSAPDYSATGATCFLNVAVYYQDSLAPGDIESFKVVSPTGWQWTLSPQDTGFGTSSSGRSYYRARLYHGANPKMLPLAGKWTFTINLKSGASSSYQRTLHEPGSSADATHQYLYTREDMTLTDTGQYAAALGRFPVQGFSVQYSAASGGSITSTGLSTVKTGFLAGEQRAYNMYCWLFDGNNTYLGYTTTEYSTVDHTSTGLITPGNELAIVPAMTFSSTGQVDLAQVRFIRIVVTDGGQYAPASYSAYDHRSFSFPIPVN